VTTIRSGNAFEKYRLTHQRFADDLRPNHPPDHPRQTAETEHTVSGGKLQTGLDGGGKSHE
jgi:hypothetical protein